MKVVLVWLSLLFWLAQAQAATHLVAIGGGPNRPLQALRQLLDWSQAPASTNVLILTWASAEPQASFDDLKQSFEPVHPGSLTLSPSPPATPAELALFRQQLASADAVFFSGGDQSRVMDYLNSSGGQEAASLLISRFQAGVPFGGTSAGTALLSRIMIVGGDLTIPNHPLVLGTGIGFLPEPVIVDQHFTQRKRLSRLEAAVRGSPGHYGVGIDEDTALLIEQGSPARVVGDHNVTVVRPEADGTLSHLTLSSGDQLTLNSGQ
jgi:cyanophycinase